MKIRKIISVVLIVITALGILSIPANARTLIDSYSVTEGGTLLFHIGGTKYTYYFYYDWDHKRFWKNKPLSRTLDHVRGTGDGYLEITEEVSLTYSTTLDYNYAVTGEVGVNKIISISAQKGYGVSTGIAFEMSASNSLGKTIPSSAPTGYYKIVPSQTERSCCYWKYNNKEYHYVGGEHRYYMPYGDTLTSIVYSNNNTYWSFFTTPCE